MATRAMRRGYGWSLPGMAPDRPSNEVNNVRVFSAKGLSASGVLGTSPLPQIGVPIPGTNLVYVRPRLSQDEGLDGGGGGSQFPYQRYRFPGQLVSSGPAIGARLPQAVHLTNPAYLFYRRYQRTPSIGAGAALSMGRVMSVPFESDAPYFSIA